MNGEGGREEDGRGGGGRGGGKGGVGIGEHDGGRVGGGVSDSFSAMSDSLLNRLEGLKELICMRCGDQHDQLRNEAEVRSFVFLSYFLFYLLFG